MKTSHLKKAPARTPKLSLKGIPIEKVVHPGWLLDELHQQLGITGSVQSDGQKAILAVKTRTRDVTDAQIQQVIDAHDPTKPPAGSVAAQLASWSTLSDTERNALMLTVLKRLQRI